MQFCMFRSIKLFAAGLVLIIGLAACQKPAVLYNDKIPPKILWAWEREEDFRSPVYDKFGVAFHAQTIFLQGSEVVLKPRRQPLQVNENTYLIAVTRIETSKQDRPSLTEKQLTEINDLILKTLQLKNVKALQIDFDAVVSEREFYRSLLKDLRPKSGVEIPLTITALGSWCMSDNWLGDLPIDEAIPMLFDMGTDDKSVKSFLASNKDWNEPLCRTSYGLSINQPLDYKFLPDRRIYYFSSSSWKPANLSQIK
jgi:hypothetical protein